jgi:zinc transport system ATP-binding protein
MDPPRSSAAARPPATTAPVLALRALRVGYDGRALLPPIDARIGQGEVWGIIGPNGAGKSTLLKTILRLQHPVSGVCAWGPDDRIGYVPQRSRLDLSVPARTVDIVRGGLDRGWAFAVPFLGLRRGAAVRRALADTQTSELARQQFAELSEGQKQRVLMARALAGDPAVLVLDEPTSAMDQTAEAAVFELMTQLARDRGLTVLFVSHHLAAVGRYATHLLLVDRDRQLAVVGPTAEVAAREEVTSLFGAILPDSSRPHDQRAAQ